MLRCFIALLVLGCQLNYEMMTGVGLLVASYFNILYARVLNTLFFICYLLLVDLIEFMNDVVIILMI